MSHGMNQRLSTNEYDIADLKKQFFMSMDFMEDFCGYVCDRFEREDFFMDRFVVEMQRLAMRHDPYYQQQESSK